MADTGKTYTTHAICLKAYDYGEADRILHLYSPEYGRISAIAKGVRRQGSKLSGAAEPLCINEIHCARGKNMDVVNQYQSLRAFSGIRTDMLKLAFSSLYAELTHLIATENDSDSETVFALLCQSLDALDIASDTPEAIIPLATDFQMRLLEVAGYQPCLLTCVITDEAVDFDMPFHPFSAELGGIANSDDAGQSAKVRWVNIATPTLMALNEPLGGHWQPETYLKSQKFLQYYIAHKLERPIKAYDFLFQVLDT